ALLASGRYDQLLAELTTKGLSLDRRYYVQLERIHTLATKGDNEKARAAVQEIVHEFAGQIEMRQWVQSFQKTAEISICCAGNDAPGYIRAMGNEHTFESAFLEGKYGETMALVLQGKNVNVLCNNGLLYVGLHKAGIMKAGETHWRQFLDALQKEGRGGRRCAAILAGKQPVDLEYLRRLAMEPRNKRVVLAVIAKRYPEHGKDLLAMARKLDYQRDP